MFLRRCKVFPTRTSQIYCSTRRYTTKTYHESEVISYLHAPFTKTNQYPHFSDFRTRISFPEKVKEDKDWLVMKWNETDGDNCDITSHNDPIDRRLCKAVKGHLTTQHLKCRDKVVKERGNPGWKIESMVSVQLFLRVNNMDHKDCKFFLSAECPPFDKNCVKHLSLITAFFL